MSGDDVRTGSDETLQLFINGQSPRDMADPDGIKPSRLPPRCDAD